ncbi:MAG: PKD domain-containing protein [Thermoplasmatales archaeon]|nr:MAG: PKD domain-containing protein [Thermoplasmatales archaeon]
MNQKKVRSTLTIGIMLILIVAAFSSIAVAYPVTCTIRGYVIDEKENGTIQPDGITLSFEGQADILADHIYEDGYYEITEDIEPGIVGSFYITISGQGTWQAEESIMIQSDIQFYKRNLTINTSSPPIGDDDDDTPPTDDDDDGGGGGNGGGGGGGSHTTGDDDDDDDDDGGGGGGFYQPPVANTSGSDEVGYTEVPVTFDGSNSIGNIISYEWDFGDGNTGTGEITLHTYNDAGVYTVTLTVADIIETNTTTTVITITELPNIPPTIPIVTGPKTGTKNTEYSYTAVSTDDDNHTIQYTFDWGDGETTTTEFLPNGTVTPPQNHTWTSAGKYTIDVKADDNRTESGIKSLIILIDAINVTDSGLYIGYMTDDDADGTYDKFHTTGVETDVEKQNDGTYLIDNDGDEEWDYVYDPDTDTLTEYTPINDAMWYMLGLGLIIAIAFLLVIYLALKKKKKPKKETKKSGKSTKKK